MMLRAQTTAQKQLRLMVRPTVTLRQINHWELPVRRPLTALRTLQSHLTLRERSAPTTLMMFTMFT